jgi:hypothetical protein
LHQFAVVTSDDVSSFLQSLVFLVNKSVQNKGRLVVRLPLRQAAKELSADWNPYLSQRVFSKFWDDILTRADGTGILAVLLTQLPMLLQTFTNTVRTPYDLLYSLSSFADPFSAEFRLFLELADTGTPAFQRTALYYCASLVDLATAFLQKFLAFDATHFSDLPPFFPGIYTMLMERRAPATILHFLH